MSLRKCKHTTRRKTDMLIHLCFTRILCESVDGCHNEVTYIYLKFFLCFIAELTENGTFYGKMYSIHFFAEDMYWCVVLSILKVCLDEVMYLFQWNHAVNDVDLQAHNRMIY